MKVILKQEVDNLGLAGDVVDVADGYGRNFLIPRGMAILASKGAMKEAQTLLRARKVKEAQTLDQAEAVRETLESRPLQIKVRVDERGHLYGSVGVADVHRVLRERGHQIEKKRIDLRGSIKEIGTYEVPVQVHPQVLANVEIEVVDEEGLVIAGQIAEPEVPPLPGEVVEDAPADATDAVEATEEDLSVEALVEQAIEAAEKFEAEAAEAEAAEADDAEASDAGDGEPTEG